MLSDRQPLQPSAPWNRLVGKDAEMDREQLRKQLADILENETGTRPAVITDGIKLKEELGLDSVDVVSLMMQIEATYRIRLSREDLEPVATVGDLLTLLQSKMAAADAGNKAAA